MVAQNACPLSKLHLCSARTGVEKRDAKSTSPDSKRDAESTNGHRKRDAGSTTLPAENTV
jgi:hypothetical protein